MMTVKKNSDYMNFFDAKNKVSIYLLFLFLSTK